MRAFAPLAALLLSASATAAPGKGKIKNTKHPDYVIIGGGPAGFVLAAEISQNPDVSVVLVEAGPENAGIKEINIPGYAPALLNTPSTWNYSSQPDARISNHAPPIFQGRGFGGGSAVGSLEACRGAPSVYDEWAEISGDEGLRWENLANNFKATAHFIEADLDYDPHVNPDAYGDGPVELTAPTDMLGFVLGLVQAWADVLGLTRVDLNDGTGLGISTGTQMIRATNRTRNYASQAYGWELAGRRNVRVLYNAEVVKIGFKGTRATSVTYINPITGKKAMLRPKEIIVAAGAIGSPKLLMLSGIGPAANLTALGIDVVADIPQVGQNLRDHHLSFMSFEVDSTLETFWQYTQNATFAPMAEADYLRNGSGPLGVSNSAAFALARAPDSIFQAMGDPYHLNLPADRGHLLFQYSSSALSAAPNVSVVSLFVSLVQPEASGYLQLASADYRDPPIIYSNYFGSNGDKYIMLYGYKKLREISNNAAFRPHIVREIVPGNTARNDVELWDSMSTVSQSMNHALGTVALGTVVEGKTWRIKGLDGIRVVDSSTFPTMPTCHIMAAVYAYAHHAAQLIKEQDA